LARAVLSGPRAKRGRQEPGAAGAECERELLARLRAGDESAFVALVHTLHAPLLRLARFLLRDTSAAEEAVQDTWLGALRGLPRFEGRSSLKTWIYRILLNRARSLRARRSRLVPFADLGRLDVGSGGDEPYPAFRYLPATHPTEPQHWALPPSRWPTTPEEALLSSEVRSQLKAAILDLPEAQREVLTLRDVEGLSAVEVCNVLRLSETNQRVLLHRARTRVRKALEGHFLRE